MEKVSLSTKDWLLTHDRSYFVSQIFVDPKSITEVTYRIPFSDSETRESKILIFYPTIIDGASTF